MPACRDFSDALSAFGFEGLAGLGAAASGGKRERERECVRERASETGGVGRLLTQKGKQGGARLESP